MGQNISTHKKKYSSLIIGYKSITPTELRESDDYNNDNVLLEPHHYNLSHKISQLCKDLIYIDQAYYNEIKQNEHQKTLIPSDPITFKDTLYKNQRNIYDFYLARAGLKCLSPNIGLLTTIRRLNLSFNHLKQLPEEIGHLRHLESLQLSNNQLTSLPDSLCHLSKLRELKVANNHIKHLTPFISHLRRLHILDLENNRLKEFTLNLNQLTNLNMLDLSHNPISILPVEVVRLKSLRRLRLEGCAFTDSPQHSLVHDPPSLRELCARLMIKNEMTTCTNTALQHYMTTSSPCSFCHGPYFDTFVKRAGWTERNGQWIPVEYRLCTAHWSDENDRLYALFSFMPRHYKTSFITELPPVIGSLKESLTSSSLSTSATIMIDDKQDIK